MQLTFLGNSGLRVSELCLGAMTFGTDLGWGADENTSRAILDAYADAGGNFIDTADVYTGGTSERLLGDFLRGRRDRFVIGTKYSISRDRANANAAGNHRRNLMLALEASLGRLQTDYIDVYWVHVWDGFTPIEETITALDHAVRAGKVLHIGFSDLPAWLIARADAIAEITRASRPAAIQVEYNLAQREAERDLIPMAETLGMSVLNWSPLGGGALTGKLLHPPADEDYEGRVASSAIPRAFDKYKGDRATAITKELVAAAEALECSAAQLAIAWLRRRSPANIPIIGARSVKQLADNLGAVHIDIPDAVIDHLDEVSRIDLGFPHDFIRDGWRDWFGDAPLRLDPRIRPQGRRALGLDDPR